MGRLGTGDVVQAWSQTRDTITFTAVQLAAEVAGVRAGLKRLGIGVGDRVAAYLPNTTEALVVLLATASLGAVFSSCPPEFGVRRSSIGSNRFSPRILIAADGYCHRERAIDKRPDVAEIRLSVPSIEHVVEVPYLSEREMGGALSWTELRDGPTEPLEFVRVPFDHPLYVLFSSGTTGRPKPIVHGHGGILLEHVKTHYLHHDLGPSDRFFWYSTTGWMMWNYLVSGLVTGASIILFDGDSSYPDMNVLWELAESSGITVSEPVPRSSWRANVQGLIRAGAMTCGSSVKSGLPAHPSAQTDSAGSTNRWGETSAWRRSAEGPMFVVHLSVVSVSSQSWRGRSRADIWGREWKLSMPWAFGDRSGGGAGDHQTDAFHACRPME